MIQVKVILLPEVIIHGRKYRATNFMRIQKGKKWAEVDCWIDGAGWKAVYDYDRVLMVEDALGSKNKIGEWIYE